MRNQFLSSRASDDILEQQIANYILNLLEKDAIRKFRKKTMPLKNGNGFVFYYGNTKGVVQQHQNKVVYSVLSLGDSEMPEGEVIDYVVYNLPVNTMGDIYPNSPEYKFLQKAMFDFFEDMNTVPRNTQWSLSPSSIPRFASDDVLEQQIADYILNLLEKDAIRKFRTKTRPLKMGNGFSFFFGNIIGTVSKKNKQVVFYAKYPEGDPNYEYEDQLILNLPVNTMGDIYPNSPEYKVLQKSMFDFFINMNLGRTKYSPN